MIPENLEDIFLCSKPVFLTFVTRRMLSLFLPAVGLSLCLGKLDQAERKRLSPISYVNLR